MADCDCLLSHVIEGKGGKTGHELIRVTKNSLLCDFGLIFGFQPVFQRFKHATRLKRFCQKNIDKNLKTPCCLVSRTPFSDHVYSQHLAIFFKCPLQSIRLKIIKKHLHRKKNYKCATVFMLHWLSLHVYILKVGTLSVHVSAQTANNKNALINIKSLMNLKDFLD